MAIEAGSTYGPKYRNPEQYAKAMIKMLENDFHIYPTDKQKSHLGELKNRVQIDNAVQSIMTAYYDRY